MCDYRNHSCSDLNTSEPSQDNLLNAIAQKTTLTYRGRWEVLTYSKLEVTLRRRTAVSELESMWRRQSLYTDDHHAPLLRGK